MKAGSASAEKLISLRRALALHISQPNERMSSTDCDAESSGRAERFTRACCGPGDAFMIGTGRYPCAARSIASLTASPPGMSMITAPRSDGLCSSTFADGVDPTASASPTHSICANSAGETQGDQTESLDAQISNN